MINFSCTDKFINELPIYVAVSFRLKSSRKIKKRPFNIAKIKVHNTFQSMKRRYKYTFNLQTGCNVQFKKYFYERVRVVFFLNCIINNNLYKEKIVFLLFIYNEL